MSKKILIVEDEFIEANNLKMILERAGYYVCRIAPSFAIAMTVVDEENPDLVLLDIYLKGSKTGIDLAKILKKRKIAFVYLSANSDSNILALAKQTEPYGFLVKPFRGKDVLVTLDIANYLHEQKQKLFILDQNQLLQSSQGGLSFEGIVGTSAILKEVFHNVQVVAPTDTSVLIIGESGTGKEKLVDAIHNNSYRKSKPLIKVNCAALPYSLIETELFGHERGAFTGATERRIGKFEQANGGTIFLDEIGDLPLDMQVKLLRVLQEKEIERIGGKTVIKINVRFVAATNRSLEKDMAAGLFRIDLYYRLNVFPINVPPLRDRKEDIPSLVKYFVEQFNNGHAGRPKVFSKKAMATLMSYDWPGNIRELENLVERSVLLFSDNNIIDNVIIPGAYLKDAGEANIDISRVKTMEENEVGHILEVLKICNGKLSGPGGAAELLGIPYSTLASKIKRLGIKDEFIYR